jgi:hypothetical protein
VLRDRLSYANVTATLALFVALGGSGYAAAKIRGKDIAPRTITAKHLKRGTLTGKELARGAVTAVKLSPALRARLPVDDDQGFDSEPLPGFDGLPGPPGDPGEPGEPGPPGTACAAELALLCGDGALDGDPVTLNGTQLRASAYRISCARDSNPDCTVLLAGPLPATAAAAVYANDDPRGMTLAIGTRTVQLGNPQPTSLATQGDRWQLTITAGSATG